MKNSSDLQSTTWLTDSISSSSLKRVFKTELQHPLVNKEALAIVTSLAIRLKSTPASS